LSGWFEWQVFDAAQQLENAQSLTANLQIADADGNRNELDVAFLHRNCLCILECKTRRMDRQADDFHGPTADAIYKLEALRKTGGLRTKGILISFLPVNDHQKNRAQTAGITVIDQSGLPRLREL
jgi:hypothetical protein